ncbi:hypothetical protein [Novosphingobium fuchskuhlense]|nr:hypothetical protein [Novosphingobium fuchskuhlense]
MARALALAAASAPAASLAEVLRSAIVFGSAFALILAGRAFPLF